MRERQRRYFFDRSLTTLKEDEQRKKISTLKRILKQLSQNQGLFFSLGFVCSILEKEPSRVL